MVGMGTKRQQEEVRLCLDFGGCYPNLYTHGIKQHPDILTHIDM